MTHRRSVSRNRVRSPSSLAALALAASAPAAAPAGTDLWGGPAAKGAGTNARFDTNIYVSSPRRRDRLRRLRRRRRGRSRPSPFTLPSRGVAVDRHARGRSTAWARSSTTCASDAPVTAWSETYNDTPTGRFGTVVHGLPRLRLPRRPATSRGAAAPTRRRPRTPGRARTNVGVLCSPLGAQGCNVEVRRLRRRHARRLRRRSSPSPARPAQQPLATLVPATAEKSKLALRCARAPRARRCRTPSRTTTSRATAAASRSPSSRGAFSTAPVINSFTISPSSGCSPLTALATWIDDRRRPREHHGRRGRPRRRPARRPSRSSSTGDVILTAVAASGATSTAAASASPLNAAHDPPTPTPVLGVDGHRPDRSRASSRANVGRSSRSRSTSTSPRARRSPSTATSSRTRPASTTGTDVVRLTSPAAPAGPATRHVHGHRHRARRRRSIDVVHGRPGARLRRVDEHRPVVDDGERARRRHRSSCPRPSVLRRTARSARRSPARRRSR